MAKVAVLGEKRMFLGGDTSAGFPSGYFTFVNDADHLIEEAASHRITAALVALSEVTTSVLRLISLQIAERSPDVALFGFASRPVNEVAVTALSGCGPALAAVFFGNFEDVVRGIGALITPRDTSPVTLAMRVVRDVVPREMQAFLELALKRASEHPTVEQLARDARTAHRTLSERLVRAGLPDAREILSWCRILQAAHAIEHSDASLSRIAEEYGFTSDAALRGMVRRRLAVTPSDLRERGGFDRALSSFERMLRQARGHARRRKSSALDATED